MYSAESAIYGLNTEARHIAAVTGEMENHQFLVGTAGVRDDNELHLIQFSEENNQISPLAVYKHPQQIWYTTPCPTNKKLFWTVYYGGQDFKASLWTPEESDSKSETINLKQLVELKGVPGTIKKIIWNNSESSNTVIASFDAENILMWSMDANGNSLSKSEPIGTIKVPNGDPMAGCWDPHHSQRFVSVNQEHIRIWDCRTFKEEQTIKYAHEDTIRDVDFNPNKPYQVVTGGEDRRIKFWDTRKPQTPIKLLARHTHWVTNVKYNLSHDQLVLSAGTDSAVNLWSIVSISSAPLGDLEDPANQKEGDKLIKTFDDHEDSVYSIAWSVCDAWVFASLSHDGRVVTNHVPPAEKYKILL